MLSNNNSDTIQVVTDKKTYNFKREALSEYIEQQICRDKKSFLLVSIPNSNGDFLPVNIVKELATENVKKEIEIVEQTIPENSNFLSDFHYTYTQLPNFPDPSTHTDSQSYIQALPLLTNQTPGLFTNDIDNGKFRFVTQRHYEAVGDFAVKYIQDELLVKVCQLDEVWLPLDMDANQDKDKMVNIYMSKDALTNPNKLMVLIQGSGAVRPGLWARALCLNDSLKTGTQYNYIVQAMQNGYGVIVLNPNQNTYIPSELDDPLKYKKEGYLKTKNEPLAKGVKKPIKGNQSPPDHTVYVWDNFISKALAKDINIVAHSAGGWCTMELFKARMKDVLQRVRGVAFTDSVHSVYSSDPKEVRQFIINNAINWVTSDKPCDVVVNSKSSSGCECRSAGHNKHEYTSEFCREAAFSFLNSKLTQ